MQNKRAISASYLKVIFDALEAKSINTQPLKEKANITDDLIASPDAFIDEEQYQTLISEAVKVSQDPNLGLYIGKSLEVGTHGILSYAALGMPTVWECLKLGEEFAQIRSPIIQVQLSLENDDAVIRFDTRAFTDEVYQFIIEGAICAYFAILNLVYENKIPATIIRVRYKAPADIEAYQNMLGEKVAFSCPKNEIRLPRASVNKTLQTANTFIAKELEHHIHELLQTVEEQSLTEKIQLFLSNNNGKFPTQESIANHLNLSTRTLRRQLKDEDTSYQNLLNDCRRDLAIAHLKNTNSSIEEIAYALGFSSAPHFSYAFKQWTGTAPKFYRSESQKNT
ncbi:MAG: AraC family transcriptional regulator [Pseudomonadales bacterium]|nr:AraC family transcriptional regulator [Pseudomonadales bacterium]